MLTVKTGRLEPVALLAPPATGRAPTYQTYPGGRLTLVAVLVVVYVVVGVVVGVLT